MAHVPMTPYQKLVEKATQAVMLVVANVPLRAEIVTEREDPSDPFSPIARQYEIEERPGIVYLRFKKTTGFVRWLREAGYGQRFEDARGFWLPMVHLGVPKELHNMRRRQEAAAQVAAAIFKGAGEDCEIWINTF